MSQATATSSPAPTDISLWLAELLARQLSRTLEASRPPSDAILTRRLAAMRTACAAHVDPAQLSFHALAGVTDSGRLHAGFGIISPNPAVLWVACLGDTKGRYANGSHLSPPPPDIRVLTRDRLPPEMVVLAQPIGLQLGHQGMLDELLRAMRRAGSTVRYAGSSIWPARVLKALCMAIPVMLVMPQGVYSPADIAITIRCLLSSHYQFYRFDELESLVQITPESLLSHPDGVISNDLIVLPPGITIAAIRNAVEQVEPPPAHARIRVSI